MRASLLLFTLCILIFPQQTRAEFTSSLQRWTLRETNLREEPSDKAMSYGILPKGTRVQKLGEVRGEYEQVSVELTPETLEGWILTSTLAERPSNEPVLSAGKIQVPEEEAILLRRPKTFWYGAHIGPNYSIASSSVVDYTGLAFTAAFSVGFYLDPNSVLEFSLGYQQVEAKDADRFGISFGFLNIASHYHLFLNSWDVYAGLQFGLGLSAGRTPNDINISSPSELSSPYLSLGALYPCILGKYSSLLIGPEYQFSIARNPVGFHLFWLQIVARFSG